MKTRCNEHKECILLGSIHNTSFSLISFVSVYAQEVMCIIVN
jgi:hypothetical protein